MPNISTNNKNSIYKYTGTITTLFKNDKDPLTIAGIRIKSMVIDYDYDRHNIPLIYATIALTYDMMNKLKDNMNTGTVVVNIQKYVENSDMPGLKIDVIKKECVYFMSSDAAKNKEQALNPDRTEDYGYVTTIGFIALDHINKNKTAVNGVIKNGTMSSGLYYVLKGHNLLMEPLKNNATLKQVFIPPSKSVAKIIKYFNSISTFYDTPYRFFMDFNTTYLMSSSGKGLKKKGETIGTVRIKLVAKYNEDNMEGMYEDKVNFMYMLNVSATYATLAQNSVTDKTYSSIAGISTSGATSKEQLNIAKDSIIKPNTSNIRISNNNTKLITNMKVAAQNNSTIISINKNKIDGSVFTINKVYYINTDDVYGKEFSGNYLLSAKKEVYMQEGEGLAMSIMLYFKKVSTIDNQVGN